MKKCILILIMSLFFFYFSLEDVSAGLNICSPCTPSPIDPCNPYYSSGDICYHGTSSKKITCDSGGVSPFQNWCMYFASAVDKTGPLDADKFYCSGPSITHFEGYVNMDTNNPITEPLCQTKECDSTGWVAKAKPNTEDCSVVKDGKVGNCKAGVWGECECMCSDKTICSDCSTATPGAKCVNQNGVGKLFEKHPDCDKACMKYNVYDGAQSGNGETKQSMPEICVDTPVLKDGVTVYENYKLDEYYGSGNRIKETYCDANDKCQYQTINCSSSEMPFRKIVDPKKMPILDPANPLPDAYLPDGSVNPLAKYAYYCGWGINLPPGTCYNGLKDGDETNTDCGGSCPPCPEATCNENGIQDNGETGIDCGGGGCTRPCNECQAGNPPYQRDGTANCNKCGCPPSEYKPGQYASSCSPTGYIESPGSGVSCNGASGYCEYGAPPGLGAQEPPDCSFNGPDGEFNKTYTLTTLYFLSGNNAGSFSGYNWSGYNSTDWTEIDPIGHKWRTYPPISPAAVSSNAAPAVFFENGNTYLISGRSEGDFKGYNWTGTGWSSYDAIASTLTDVGTNSKPSLFYKDGKWNMISGDSTGRFSGFTYTGTNWVVNNTIVTNLPDVGANSAPSVFYKKGTLYLISGNNAGGFSGYNWTGTAWQTDSNIRSSLGNEAGDSSPHVFYIDAMLYLITGNSNGGFKGYNWTGGEWQTDSEITSGLSVSGTSSSPAIFSIDSYYTKTIKYKTVFSIDKMEEYPNSGSQCFQNKTTITIPEGHVCVVNMYANTSHGWGVRLKATNVPGSTLLQDPFSTCGYISENLYNYCQPLGFGNTNCCPAKLTPSLGEGTYEFGIVSSSGGINNGKVSKACAYLERCADCDNPYAQYYCDLCKKDQCNDGTQNCEETGIDCGSSCMQGAETDNSYTPVFEFTEPPGLANTVLFTVNNGLNCVDGIDNDRDCLVDCADPDCASGVICSYETDPPNTSYVIIYPPAPTDKGWYLSEVKAAFNCFDGAGSGCAFTTYRVNNGEWKTYNPPYFFITENGINLIEYFSEDNAGNVETVKSNTTKIFTGNPTLLFSEKSRITVLIGDYGQMIVKVKNSFLAHDTLELSVTGMPSSTLHNWIWFTGHGNDQKRYKINIELDPDEERSITVDIFGGQILSDGILKVNSVSEATGAESETSAYVDIVYSDPDGLNAETPEFGWIGFIIIAVLSALLINRKTIIKSTI